VRILLIALALAGCATAPKLPAPGIYNPQPPAALMEPARKMETIPVVSK
jgi:hypothetical protein